MVYDYRSFVCKYFTGGGSRFKTHGKCTTEVVKKIFLYCGNHIRKRVTDNSIEQHLEWTKLTTFCAINDWNDENVLLGHEPPNDQEL